MLVRRRSATKAYSGNLGTGRAHSLFAQVSLRSPWPEGLHSSGERTCPAGSVCSVGFSQVIQHCKDNSHALRTECHDGSRLSLLQNCWSWPSLHIRRENARGDCSCGIPNFSLGTSTPVQTLAGYSNLSHSLLITALRSVTFNTLSLLASNLPRMLEY